MNITVSRGPKYSLYKGDFCEHRLVELDVGDIVDALAKARGET